MTWLKSRSLPANHNVIVRIHLLRYDVDVGGVLVLAQEIQIAEVVEHKTTGVADEYKREARRQGECAKESRVDGCSG